MKQKIMLMLLVVFTGILGTRAQVQDQSQPRPRRTVEERVKMVMAKLTLELQLNATQQPAAEATFTEYFKATSKLMEGLEPGTRPDRAEMMILSEARDVKLKTTLTEVQFKKFKDEIEPTMRRGGGGQRPAEKAPEKN